MYTEPSVISLPDLCPRATLAHERQAAYVSTFTNGTVHNAKNLAMVLMIVEQNTHTQTYVHSKHHTAFVETNDDHDIDNRHR